MKNIVYNLSFVALMVPAFAVSTDAVPVSTSDKPGFMRQATTLIKSVGADTATYVKESAVAAKNHVSTHGKVVVADPVALLKSFVSVKTLQDTVDRVSESTALKCWAVGFGAILFNSRGFKRLVHISVDQNALVNQFTLRQSVNTRYYLLGLACLGYHYLAAAYQNAYQDQVLDVVDDQMQEEAQPAKKCTKCTSSGCRGGRCGR